MPEATPPHPTPRQLADFGLGKLPRDQAARVAAHLDGCAECRRQLEGQPPDSFVNKLKVAAPRGETVPPTPGFPALGQPLAPRKKPLDIPPVLAGSSKFEVLAKLGEGGMGAVWKAKHVLLDCLVAIKVLNPSMAAQGDAQARFLQEMRAAGKLRHRNIVRAFDAEQVGDSFLLVMEYVEGINLDQLVKQKGRLRLDFACRLVAQAAQGLQHAHEQGMVHRDIKPANLMITRAEKEVKILDFGLARLTGQAAARRVQTAYQTFMGTPDYVAPEQATDARSADIRADLYSLGCTLYCLLSGRAPFQADTALNLIVAHIHQEARPLSAVRPDVPAELSAIVARMMAKKPAERFSTPAEVVQALQPFTASDRKGGGVESGEMLAYTDESENASTLPPEAGKATLPTPPPLPEGFKPAPVPRGSGARRSWRLGTRKVPGWVLFVGLVAGALAAMAGGIGLVNYLKGRPGKVGVEASGWGQEVTNSIGMKLRRIPAGAFQMGSPEKEEGRDPDEGPLHKVEITKPYWIGVYEVTQAEYVKVMGKNPSHFSAEGEGKARMRGIDTSKYPVEGLSWDDAVEFCRKLSELPEERQAGRSYRLPTEAEWEYACRGRAGGGPPEAFAFGNTLNPDQANFNNHEPKHTVPVGLYPPNAFGLYDMHGNVWEYCADWYDPKFYEKANAVDPLNAAPSDARVMRGGSWASEGKLCRSAYRQSTKVSGGPPGGGMARANQMQGVGLRVVCVPAGP